MRALRADQLSEAPSEAPDNFFCIESPQIVSEFLSPQMFVCRI